MSAVEPSQEVAGAQAEGVGIVALETSVVGQGLPHPRNLECVERMSAAVREAGAVPAWIGVVEGSVVVGLSDEQLRTFAQPDRAAKVARRDLPFALAGGGLGATTVSSTIATAMVAMEKKIPRRRSVSMPTPKPSNPEAAAPARICRPSGSANALYSATAV